ncbi:hypothetical protein [Sporomusa termitida]|uniref:Uncharacterized protein n=1 Tax=Sporomusa termitida TaxID=2377 RepID=A0A517DRT1_9FIRM|nr:hypothetical protein [Sporomusa termitida]QDR79996.1 hypothetical protein SPTER_13050 [Sporomusa termitida]
MDRVESVQPIKRTLPVRRVVSNYFDFQTEDQSKPKKRFRAKKKSPNEATKQPSAPVAGVGDHVDFKV